MCVGVVQVCTESSAPRDAEFQCFDMYLDFCRGAVEAYQGAERAKALKALRTVFHYLDQHYCNTKPRPGAETTKQATSKLASGQDLKYCGAQIEQDVRWLPLFYTTSMDPQGNPMGVPAAFKKAAVQPPSEALSRTYSEVTDLTRTISSNTQASPPSTPCFTPPSLHSSLVLRRCVRRATSTS